MGMADQKSLAALPWTSLRAFEAASRLGSFKAAASELTVTPTAISHQIKRLEMHLGIVLFERLHRSLRLTSPGRVLARELQAMFARLERNIEKLKTDGRAAAGPHGLTVSVVPSLATKWLAPRLHVFQMAHPNISLRIAADETLIDFRRDRMIDIALRYGPKPREKFMHAERLWPRGEIVAVCRPDIAKDPALKSPADLKRHMLMRTAPPKARTPPGRAPRAAEWIAWFTAAGIAMDGTFRKALDGPVFNTTQLAVEAAMAGRGIALAPRILVEMDIAAGRLVRIFPVRLVDPNSFWILCRADRFKDSRIQAFIRWIRLETRRRKTDSHLRP
jgi:LysR family transcriptional regulator, glycine cleavage system transcriptional activator